MLSLEYRVVAPRVEFIQDYTGDVKNTSRRFLRQTSLQRSLNGQPTIMVLSRRKVVIQRITVLTNGLWMMVSTCTAAMVEARHSAQVVA